MRGTVAKRLRKAARLTGKPAEYRRIRKTGATVLIGWKADYKQAKKAYR